MELMVYKQHFIYLSPSLHILAMNASETKLPKAQLVDILQQEQQQRQ